MCWCIKLLLDVLLDVVLDVLVLVLVRLLAWSSSPGRGASGRGCSRSSPDAVVDPRQGPWGRARISGQHTTSRLKRQMLPQCLHHRSYTISCIVRISGRYCCCCCCWSLQAPRNSTGRLQRHRNETQCTAWAVQPGHVGPACNTLGGRAWPVQPGLTGYVGAGRSRMGPGMDARQ